MLRVLGTFPFFEIIYRFFYARSLRILRKSLQDIDGIHDVYLTSDTTSKDFVFGVSDYNIFVIVKNHGHPKKTLKEIRNKIKKSRTTSYIINTNFIPTLTLDEFKVPQFKSYLLRNSSRDIIVWKSILDNKKTIKINASDTGWYPLIYAGMQDLDAGLFKELHDKPKRTRVKNISRSLRALDKYFSAEFSVHKNYFKKAKVYLRYPTLLNFSYKSFLKNSWLEIISLDTKSKTAVSKQTIKISRDFEVALINIMSSKFIDDITLTPSLIQLNSDRVTGKIYIDVHINDLFLKSIFFDKRISIRKEIETFQTDDLKFRIRFVSSHFHHFQLSIMATPFPLESLYRNEKCYSLKNINYSHTIDQKFTREAAINFFIIQFMRFRSSKQKTDLIGSKYIKSLNLMYRFYLLNQYLEFKEVQFTNNIEEVKELLSPQFSNIDPLQTVNAQDWIIIRAQLIHFLKQIRTHLVKTDKNLKHLRF